MRGHHCGDYRTNPDPYVGESWTCPRCLTVWRHALFSWRLVARPSLPLRLAVRFFPPPSDPRENP